MQDKMLSKLRCLMAYPLTQSVLGPIFPLL